ncbi:concanavalin A-like lectin/glucanase domain-containing protein [Boletus reticuloceps]|uniref:Concanavalin A-like lectin/glucanase domain-containing protein n=1 Tax=Boletus reticuloceps TaxID=495285 RepID=A0A8I2Z1R3_9AGAM|nr:concanavalin A-like lectin/glucanase domain-containing protein [Boletus reticuloceps]
MRFNFTLISAFLFASAVLADRGLEHRSSQLNIVEKRTNATSDSGEVIYTEWAGAGLTQSVPSFRAISGTFKVPQISGPTGSGVGIWVGIDGAVAEWSPKGGIEFTDIKVSPGDLITVTVTVNSDQTTGNATVENFKHGTNQMTVQTLEFSNQPALCQLSAEWIVSKVGNLDLANFDVVSFRKPLAFGPDDQTFTPAGSVISEIPENGKSVTAIYADENVVAIWHA